MTQRYGTADDQEKERGIDAATLALRRGQLVVLPTDTVYGVAADAFDKHAVKRLLEAKGRGRDMPPPVLISSATTAQALAEKLPDYAVALFDEFWPGALTVVGRAQRSLQWDLGDTRGTVAIRMPDHPVTLEILERTGPLAVSSANTTGQPAATTADEAADMLGDSVEVVIDAGPSPGKQASTILDVTGPSPRVLRRGAVAVEDLAPILETYDVAVEESG